MKSKLFWSATFILKQLWNTIRHLWCVFVFFLTTHQTKNRLKSAVLSHQHNQLHLLRVWPDNYSPQLYWPLPPQPVFLSTPLLLLPLLITVFSPFWTSHRHTPVRPVSTEHVAVEVLPGERLPEEAAGSRWREVHLQPMPDHPGPGGPGSGQHPGSRSVRPVWRGGQKQCWAQHHHLLLHRRCGIRLCRAVLRRVWVPRPKDRICIPLQLCDRWRAAGFHHRLESFTLLHHRQVWQNMMNNNYGTLHHAFIFFQRSW